VIGWFQGRQERRREFDTEVSKLIASLERDHGAGAADVARKKAARPQTSPLRRKVYRAVARALEQRARRKVAEV
jgi:hypothetical protein